MDDLHNSRSARLNKMLSTIDERLEVYSVEETVNRLQSYGGIGPTIAEFENDLQVHKLNNNQARRKILLDVIRQRTVMWGGHPVNKERCPILLSSPELRYLADHGYLKKKLLPQRTWGPNNWISVSHYYVPAEQLDISYLHRIKCPLCNSELDHWTDMVGGKHKEECVLRYETLQ